MRIFNEFIRFLGVGSLLFSVLVGCHPKEELPPMSGPSTTPASSLLAALPIVDSVAFSPAQPTVGEDVLASVTTGYSRQRFQFRYEWLKNGVPVEAMDGNLFPGSQTAVGDVLKVRVTPYDSAGDKKTYLSQFVVITAPSHSTLLGDGYPCKKDSQCASGSCGIGVEGMRCIGSSPHAHPGLALDAEMIGHLEAETNLALRTAQPSLSVSQRYNKRKRAKSKSRSRSAERRSSNAWDSSTASSSSSGGRSSPVRSSSTYASYAGGRAYSSSSSGLGVGANCSSGGSCGAGLVCKGIHGLSTCVPSGR